MSSALRVVTQLSFVALCSCALSAATAGEPVELARGIAPEHPQQPQLAVDAKGSIHAVFGVGDSIRYCRSDDAGKSFSAPVSLPSVHDMSLGMRRGPRIAVTEKAVCVTAVGGKHGKGRDGDVLALRSTDGGKTWSEPVLVNDTADSAREGLHAMAAGPRGELCCVWLDLRNRKTEVMASVSTDGGATWAKNILVYKSPDGSVCECCHPSVAHDSRGTIYVMWRNSLAGARDMYFAISSDGGTTFGPAAKLGAGSWPLKACPMDGGSIIAIAPGKTASVWRSEKSVFLSLEGQNEERLLGPGEQPWIVATADGPFVIWLAKRGDAAYLLTPQSKSPVKLSNKAADPVLATGPAGQGPVVAAWESRDGTNHTIQVQVVKD
jgi:hypothetical protein